MREGRVVSAHKVDVRGILERAGADTNAPEGSQAWGLAQVDAAVSELVAALKMARDYAAFIQGEESDLAMMDAALDRVGEYRA